jgi:hypothetical protein
VKHAQNGFIAFETSDGRFLNFTSDKTCVVDTCALEAARFEVVLLEGIDGFCLAPASPEGFAVELNVGAPDADATLQLVPEDNMSTFCELVVRDP